MFRGISAGWNPSRLSCETHRQRSGEHPVARTLLVAVQLGAGWDCSGSRRGIHAEFGLFWPQAVCGGSGGPTSSAELKGSLRRTKWAAHAPKHALTLRFPTGLSETRVYDRRKPPPRFPGGAQASPTWLSGDQFPSSLALPRASSPAARVALGTITTGT
jgi:hypothetical protein